MEVLHATTEHFQQEDESSEDEDIAVIKRKKTKSSFLEDDDEEEISIEDSADTIQDKAQEFIKDNPSSFDEEEQTKQNSPVRKNHRRLQIFDSDDDDDEEDGSIKPLSNKQITKPYLDEENEFNEPTRLFRKSIPNKEDSEDEENSTGSVDIKTSHETVENIDSSSRESVEDKDDSSDEDDDDSDEDGPPIRIFRSSHPPQNDGMRGYADDELFNDENSNSDYDLPPVSPSEIAQPAEAKSSRLKKDNLTDITSETQRLIRETPLNLPYHKPNEDQLRQLLRRPSAYNTPKGKSIPNELNNKESASILQEINQHEINNENEEKIRKQETLHMDNNKKDLSSNMEVDETDLDLNKDTNLNENTDVNPEHKKEDINASLEKKQCDTKLSKKFKLLQKYGIKLPDLNSTSSPSSHMLGTPKVISLDDNEDDKFATPKNTGVTSLMQRFLKQTNSGKKRQITGNATISIVKKEVRPDGSGVELVSEVVTTSTSPVEEDNYSNLSQVAGGTAGEKLILLRKQLAVKMKEKRDSERKKREELYALDNEELGDDDEEEGIEEDEESEDEDYAPDAENQEESGSEADDKENKCDRNGIINDDDDDEDDEAATQPYKVEESEDKIESANTSKISSMNSEAESSMPRMVSDNSVLLFDESTRGSSVSNVGNKACNLTNPLDRTCSDDSFYNSLIPLHQPEVSNVSSVSFNKPASKTNNDLEDDCDFGEQSQPFHFDFNASQSQLLDADGNLRETSTSSDLKAKLPTNEGLSMLAMDAGDDNARDMSELLDLCSGQFQAKGQQTQAGLSETQELLGLCSGKFNFSTNTPTNINNSQQTNDEINESFGFKIEKDKLPMESFRPSSNFDNDADSESDNDEPMMIVRKKFKKKKKQDRSDRLQQFVENEAELSGSDIGSADEHEDSEDDEYEEDVITEKLPDEEVLKAQVGKIHMRQVMNEEEEELELLKEAFADSRDGFTRERKFKWKNIDSDMTQDLFKADSENEEQDADKENIVQLDLNQDSQWRKDRLEREEFLSQKQQNIDGLVEEDSQFLQLGMKCIRRGSESISDPPKLFREDSITSDGCCNKQFKKIRKGSFLTRSSETLTKLASFQDLKNAKGPGNSNKMVFKTVSPSVNEIKKQGRRRKMEQGGGNTPAAKRIHIDEDSNSIFDLFH